MLCLQRQQRVLQFDHVQFVIPLRQLERLHSIIATLAPYLQQPQEQVESDHPEAALIHGYAKSEGQMTRNLPMLLLFILEQ